MNKNNMDMDDSEKLNRFANWVLEKKKTAMGYPINQDTSLDEFYEWYVEKKIVSRVDEQRGGPV